MYEMDWTLHTGDEFTTTDNVLQLARVVEPNRRCGCQSGLDEEKAWKRQEIPAELC
jgi:hypothetical protein